MVIAEVAEVSRVVMVWNRVNYMQFGRREILYSLEWRLKL
jgi:hypothetical protein